MSQSSIPISFFFARFTPLRETWNVMYLQMAKRVLFEMNKRLLWKMFWNLGVKGARSVMLHKKRMKRGEFFPPFLYISVINSCNLQCQGCWVDVKSKQHRLDVAAMDKLINEAKAAGNSFFGLVGGEPFMHKDLLQIIENHPDAYFQIFTNGQLITPAIAKELRRLGNVSPLVSVEGSEIVSDERRGGKQVYSRTLEGLQNCLDAKLITGVCTSVCRTNLDDMVTDEWTDRLIEMGVFYMWFHVYRAVGPDPCEDMALTPEQQRRVRQFVVDTRVRKPIGVVDAYYDHDGKALCPAVTGISHHVSPYGDVEPCPVVQFAKETIHDERGIKDTLIQSEFLSDFRKLAQDTTRGCIVLERPDLLKELAERHGARDTTQRRSAYEELAALSPKPSQGQGAEAPIPEKSLVYRLAKKWFFNDFGVYRNLQ